MHSDQSFLHDAHIIDAVRTSKALGIFDSVPNHNVQAIIDRKDTVVERLRDGIASLCKANKIELIEDEASFIDSAHNSRLKKGQEKISADVFIIATGSMPHRLPIEGAQSKKCGPVMTALILPFCLVSMLSDWRWGHRRRVGYLL
jgi:dihydrolipoamide dehydrogenase